MQVYDYESQRWIDGVAGDAVRTKQIREELELLDSAEGDAYATFIGADRSTALAILRDELASLA